MDIKDLLRDVYEIADEATRAEGSAKVGMPITSEQVKTLAHAASVLRVWHGLTADDINAAESITGLAD